MTVIYNRVTKNNFLEFEEFKKGTERNDRFEVKKKKPKTKEGSYSPDF